MFGLADEAIFAAVVLIRLLVPLLVFRFPLPSILASLVIDAADQTVFQQLTALDLTNYQSYDKALDVYYLCLAYLSTLRNWRQQDAFVIARFLFYYRLVGVALFELWERDDRLLLLVFANTFEYFFIAYHLVALVWEPQRFDRRAWLLTAAAIWIFVKLPQEYWIHVAQLDVTDAVAAHPEAALVVLVLLLALVAVVVRWLLPRLGPVDHRLTVVAPAVPGGLGTASARGRARSARGGV